MFEIFSMLWKVFVLRDSVKKGEMNWRVGAMSILFVVLLYAIGLPATILWVNHPQYEPVFILAMMLEVMLVIGFATLYFKWRARQKAAHAAQAMNAASAQNQAGQD